MNVSFWEIMTFIPFSPVLGGLWRWRRRRKLGVKYLIVQSCSKVEEVNNIFSRCLRRSRTFLTMAVVLVEQIGICWTCVCGSIRYDLVRKWSQGLVWIREIWNHFSLESFANYYDDGGARGIDRLCRFGSTQLCWPRESTHEGSLV